MGRFKVYKMNNFNSSSIQSVDYNYLVMNVYTDGSCIGNPGIGGWGWVMIKESEMADIIISGCGGEDDTTNNRMELTAIVKFLKEAPKGLNYHIYSDSKYCLQFIINGSVNGKLEGSLEACTGYFGKWERNGGAIPPKIKNRDILHSLILQLKKHLMANTVFEFSWVKGHSGNKWNDYADSLANEYAKQKDS